MSRFNIGCKIAWPDDLTLVGMVNGSSLSAVARELGVSNYTVVRNRLFRRGLYEYGDSPGLNHRRYNLGAISGENNTSYYLLGAFMTDGCVTRKMESGVMKSRVATISSVDYDWMKIIRDLVCKETPIVKQKNSKRYTAQFCSTELCKALISKGCTPAKSLTLKFPTVPDEFLPDFVRGCIDGDGSVYSYKGYKGKPYYETYICGASLQFFESLEQRLRVMGLVGSLYKRPRKNGNINGQIVYAKHDVYRFKFCGKQASNLLAWAYYPGHFLDLPRKNLKAQEAIQLFASSSRNR